MWAGFEGAFFCAIMDVMKNKYRICDETDIEKKISAQIEPIIENLDFLIVQVKILKHESVLQIMVEKNNSELNVSDCTKITIIGFRTDNFMWNIN